MNLFVSLFQRLAQLLYVAAADCSHFDPGKIEQILVVSREEANLSKHYAGIFSFVNFVIYFCTNQCRD